MPKTACIIPWTNFVVAPDGRASFCCDVPGNVTVNGRVGSVYEDSVDQLWNADELVETRAAMARGERPEGCAACWKREAAGEVSRRLLVNDAYQYIGGVLDVEALPQMGAATGYHLERRPDWFVLQMGNVCNLRCRSCDPLFSSRIAADTVQSAWSAETALADGAEAGRHKSLVRGGASAWYEDVETTADMVASGADGNALLSLMGGEPFLIKHTWRLLDALVERGVAHNILVGLATNGQQQSTKLAELAPRFRGFNLSLSIDAHGKLYEYLRHGAGWDKLVDNIRAFREMPNVDIAVVPTFQNCNALDIVTLLRFLDQQELRVAYNVLYWPARLTPANLPPSVRRIAVERLRSYLQGECKPANAAVVAGYIEVLEEPGDEFDESLFGEFMTFTNDLDASRGQNLGEAAPELLALVRSAGVQWSHERRHTIVKARGDAPVTADYVGQGTTGLTPHCRATAPRTPNARRALP